VRENAYDQVHYYEKNEMRKTKRKKKMKMVTKERTVVRMVIMKVQMNLTKEDDGKHRGSMGDETKDDLATKLEEAIFNLPESSRHS
jgi:hypothetical protein